MLVLGTHLPKVVFEIKIPLRGIGGTAPNLNFDIFDLQHPPHTSIKEHKNTKWLLT